MDFSKLAKARLTSSPRGAPEGRVSGIVKVREEGYRPNLVQVRTQIGPTMFTAEFLAEDVDAIRDDPGVELVSISEALPLQKLP